MIFCWGLKRKLKRAQEQLEDVRPLISSLESFLFVARTDKPRSLAVQYVQGEVNAYRSKWSKP